jgi:hypothetical protein
MGIAKSAAGQLPANSAIKRSSREVGKWAKSTIADPYIPRKFTKYFKLFPSHEKAPNACYV